MNKTNHPSEMVTCTLIQDFLGVKDGGIYEAVVQLKQRLDAVVAECVRVQAFAAETARDAEEMATADGGGGGYIEALNELLTPATSAALAEVEAKAIEKALNVMSGFTSDECGDSVYIAVKELANQLREGRV